MIHKLKLTSVTLLLAGAVIAPAASHAQTAYEVLDGNNIRARFNADGQLFWDGHNSAFEVPKGNGTNTISAASLWIGGLDQQGDLHLAAQTYRESGSDFWPGPLDNNGETDSHISNEYNRIWKITRAEVDSFRAGLSVPAAVLNWPGNGDVSKGLSAKMAPYVDVDSDNTYDPTKGDYPDMKGDVMLWWVFNDNLFQHSESGGQPLGIEVHASAYAFNCTADPVLNNTIFLSYKFVNRSGNDYTDVYAGLWTDLDIGNIYDDYIGSVPELNAWYGYNSGSFDKDTVISTKSGKFTFNGYGNELPSQSVMFVEGMKDDMGKEMNMSKFIYYNNDQSFTGNPKLPEQYYQYLQGKWLDGNGLTKGGSGFEGSEPTDYAFPGMPDNDAEWSEVSAGNTAGDRRGLGTFGPVSLKSGESREFTAAFTYHQGDGSAISAVRLMKKQITALDRNYRNGAISPCQALAFCQGGNDCVFPGDANNDGKAHVTDIFHIALAYGETGPVRPFASNSWAPQAGQDWDKLFPDGLDYKFADANGDGLIDSMDILPIVVNYALTHQKTDEELATSSDPTIEVKIDQDTVQAGMPLSGEIILGGDIAAEDVLGMTFSLNYDTDYFDDGSLEFDLSKSTLGSITDILAMYKKAANGKMDIGIVRKTKTGKEIDNVIIRWKIVVEGNIAGVHKEAFVIQDPVVIGPALEKIPVNIKNDEVQIIPSLSGVEEKPVRYEDLSSEVNVYPNPAQDRLTLDAGNMKINALRVFTLQGQQVLNINRPQMSTMQLDVSTLPEGLYIAEIVTAEGRAIKKFNIKR